MTLGVKTIFPGVMTLGTGESTFICWRTIVKESKKAANFMNAIRPTLLSASTVTTVTSVTVDTSGAVLRNAVMVPLAMELRDQ